jgi:3-deoxy-D-manno-octulosonate 8-phosphate phosphatase (KDO 8-P phosphatase)
MPASDSNRKLKMLVIDADGVLTDGMTWQDPEGAWRRYFSVRDGIGLRALRKAGIAVAVLCSSIEQDLRDHMEHSGVEELIEAATASARAEAIEALCAKQGLAIDEVGYVSQREEDLAVMSAMGAAFSLPTASLLVQSAATFVSSRQGGDGAVLEITNFILQNYHSQYQQGAPRSARFGRSATA